MEECRRQGITVPIIPGLKLITGKGQLTMIPRTFHCELPQPLVDEVQAAAPEQVRDVGVAWGLDQTRDLLAAGVPSVHLYVMGNSRSINQLVTQLDV